MVLRDRFLKVAMGKVCVHDPLWLAERGPHPEAGC